MAGTPVRSVGSGARGRKAAPAASEGEVIGAGIRCAGSDFKHGFNPGQFPVKDHADSVLFGDASEWRSWLEAHHRSEPELWVIINKAGVRRSGLGLQEAVEEALCFGWIDSTLRTLDDRRYRLRFSPRRPHSIWSIRNVERAERLMREGRMTEAGLSKIVEARATGEWDAARLREDTEAIPTNLRKALYRKKGAVAAFRSLPASRKKQLLHWLNTAKRLQTEEKRIRAIVEELLKG